MNLVYHRIHNKLNNRSKNNSPMRYDILSMRLRWKRVDDDVCMRLAEDKVRQGLE